VFPSTQRNKRTPEHIPLTGMQISNRINIFASAIRRRASAHAKDASPPQHVKKAYAQGVWGR